MQKLRQKTARPQPGGWTKRWRAIRPAAQGADGAFGAEAEETAEAAEDAGPDRADGISRTGRPGRPGKTGGLAAAANSRAAALLWQAAAALAGALAAGGAVFGSLHPFGLALVLAAGRPTVLAAAAGAAAGCLVLLEPVAAARYLGAVVAAAAGRVLGKARFWPGAAAGCGCLLTVQLLLSLAGFGSISDSLAALGECALALALGWAMAGQGAAGRKGALLAALGCGVASLQRFGAGMFQPGLVLFGAAGLTLAGRGRVRDTAVLSVALATALMAASPELAYAAVGTAAGCVLAAVFAPGEVLGGAALFLAGCLGGVLAAPDALSALRFLGSVAVVEALVRLLPSRLLARIQGEVPPEAQAKPSLAGAAGRLTVVAETLSDLAETVNAVYDKLPGKGEGFNWVIDQTAQEVCAGCAQREACWGKQYDATIEGFYKLKAPLEASGRLALEQLPGSFCRCLHPAQLCAGVGRAYAQYCSRRQLRAKAGSMRAALTEQYGAVAGALAQMAQQLGRDTSLDEGKTARLQTFFVGLGLEPLETAVTLDPLGRMQARVTVNRTPFSPEELTELAAEAGRICRRSFAPPQLTHCRAVSTLTFSEQPLLCPRFGLASRPAKGEVCGDASRQFCDSFGNAHLLLCDGMGTGQPAAVDGALAANLAAKLLAAGFEAEAAARLVNVALSLKSDEEGGATLDLLTVDLYTGRAALFKAGAAQSFVVSGGEPRMLEGASLPVGILEQVVGRQQTLALAAGDWVVLLSDGALTGGTGWIAQQLSLCAAVGNTPQEAADILADTARARLAPGQRPDDITVAVMALERAVG